VGALSVIGVAGIAQAIHLQRPIPIFVQPTEAIYRPSGDIFDRPFASLEVIGYEQARGGANPRLGENADIWTCVPRNTNAQIEFVLSQPYAGWHELCICYEINAWILLNREIRGSADAQTVSRGKVNQPYAFARFKSSDGRFAYLAYSAVDADGNIIEPPPQPGRLGNRFMEYLGENNQASHSHLMMLQMLIIANDRIDRDKLRELAADFVEMRSLIQRGVKQRLGPSEAIRPSGSATGSLATED
jgi:hypothetical protein